MMHSAGQQLGFLLENGWIEAILRTNVNVAMEQSIHQYLNRRGFLYESSLVT